MPPERLTLSMRRIGPGDKVVATLPPNSIYNLMAVPVHAFLTIPTSGGISYGVVSFRVPQTSVLDSRRIELTCPPVAANRTDSVPPGRYLVVLSGSSAGVVFSTVLASSDPDVVDVVEQPVGGGVSLPQPTMLPGAPGFLPPTFGVPSLPPFSPPAGPPALIVDISRFGNIPVDAGAVLRLPTSFGGLVPGPGPFPLRAPTPPGPPPISLPVGTTTAGNEIKLLLDGKEFFDEFYNELQRVKNSESDKYVHLAYWDAYHRMTIKGFGTSSPITLGDELRAVARSGAPVKVILWEGQPLTPGSPSTGSSGGGSPSIAGGDNTEFKTALNNAEGRMIQVRLEDYGGFAMTQHQKIAIFSADGDAHVIVSGENLSNFYWDEPGHPGAVKYKGSGYLGTIHDTALWFRGPATADVEREWDRRWRKVESSPAEGPTPAAALPSNVTINIATTDHENNNIRNIQRNLIAAISEAQDYVYLENFGIIDSALITALAARVQANPFLVIICNIPAPRFFGSVLPGTK